MFFLLFPFCLSLSYVCSYPEFSLGDSNYLYKEELVDVVKWLDKFEYCRAKGDSSVYSDAGQAKCEYSRGICYWDGGCRETFRENDSFDECLALLSNNELSFELDNGRLTIPTVEEDSEEDPEEVDEPQETETPSYASKSFSLFCFLFVSLIQNF